MVFSAQPQAAGAPRLQSQERSVKSSQHANLDKSVGGKTHWKNSSIRMNFGDIAKGYEKSSATEKGR